MEEVHLPGGRFEVVYKRGPSQQVLRRIREDETEIQILGSHQ